MEDSEFYDRMGDGPEMTDDFYSDSFGGDDSAGNDSKQSRESKGRNTSGGGSELAQRKRNNYRNQRYSEAYGDYRGGYGPGHGYGPYGPPAPPQMAPDFFGAPRGPTVGPIEFWGRGYNVPGGFSGGRGDGGGAQQKRPENRAIVYMRRCGVAKDHLKSLPRDLLNLIEPQYCGLCGHNFESYATSRMHYISKNHLKKMKKWVTNKDSSYQRSTKEIPMKARELYCELCDVHITSKVHAESHYSGKPHRAIVEGRKNPKNPFLLQANMKDRLEQLIRREKKNLKVVEETEVDPTRDELGDAKSAINPDLYCEICKTSVTCSEQMTMHLNGKRHLSREKQYILKMMKGGTDKNKNKAGNDGDEKNGDEDDDEEMEGETLQVVYSTEQNQVSSIISDMDCSGEHQRTAGAVGGENDDWVNGDGDNWDDTH